MTSYTYGSLAEMLGRETGNRVSLPLKNTYIRWKGDGLREIEIVLCDDVIATMFPNGLCMLTDRGQGMTRTMQSRINLILFKHGVTVLRRKGVYRLFPLGEDKQVITDVVPNMFIDLNNPLGMVKT